MDTHMNQDENDTLNVSIKRPAWFGIIVFILLFVGGGGWLSMAQISGAVIGTGAVSVEGRSKAIQHLDGGIVTEILIENGDTVQSGDVLIRLDDTLLISNLEIYENRLQEAIARKARLEAERDDDRKVIWDEALLSRLKLEVDDAVRNGQEKLFEARRKTRLGQLEQLSEKIAQYENQSHGLVEVVASKQEQMRLLTIEHEALNALSKQGYAAENRVLAMQRQIEELKGQVAEHHAELASIENSVSETKIQMLQVEREFSQNVLMELREVESSVNDLIQQLQATREQLSRVEIHAPVSGIVHALNVYTVGGVIGSGNVVMEIVPQSERLIFEVNIEPQFIDQVYPGQSAGVVFSAFNARTTPRLNGYIHTISADSIVNEEAKTNFYQVQVSVPDKELERLNGLKLVPGMPVEVFLETEYRTPLNYLLKPLMDNFQRALRED